jgi:hypothetical protein
MEARMRFVRTGVLAALSSLLVLAACSDGTPTHSRAASAELAKPRFSGTCTVDQKHGEGSITRSGDQLTLFAYAQNECDAGQVLVQADMYWGGVNDCSESVPHTVYGYPPYTGYQGAAYAVGSSYASVSRTAIPSGGTKIKAVMVSLHRFYEGAAYASSFTEHTRTTTFCADRVTTPVSVTASSPGYVDAPGTYSATASPAGGNGTYTYQWEVAYGWSWIWSQLGTGQSQSVNLYGGEGDVHLRVTISSNGQSSTAMAYIQNAINCGGNTAC